MDMFILDLSLSDSLSDSLSSSLQWVCSKRKYSVDRKNPIRIRIRFSVRIRIRFSGFGPYERLRTSDLQLPVMHLLRAGHILSALTITFFLELLPFLLYWFYG